MEISNSLVAVLVVAAIVISVAGTMTTLNIINQFTLVPGDITGHIAGTVNVTVNESVIINWVVQQINFTLNTPESGLEFWNDTSDDQPPPFKIRNDGSVNVNVNSTICWPASW